MENTKAFEPNIDPENTTVQALFAQILHSRIQAGAVEEAITKRVDSLINSVADDVFSRYSDVNKALKDAMTKAIVPQLESIGDLPVYHDFVINRLKLAANNFYDQRLAAVVDAELKEIFTELPEQITLSWLIDQLIEDAKDSDGDYEGQITLIVRDTGDEYSWSKSGDYVDVYLDTEPDKSQRDCEFDLHLTLDKKTGKYNLLGLRVKGKEAGEQLSFGRIYKYEKILFNLYTMKSLIDLDKGLDADDYDTSFEREDGCRC